MCIFVLYGCSLTFGEISNIGRGADYIYNIYKFYLGACVQNAV